MVWRLSEVMCLKPLAQCSVYMSYSYGYPQYMSYSYKVGRSMIVDQLLWYELGLWAQEVLSLDSWLIRVCSVTLEMPPNHLSLWVLICKLITIVRHSRVVVRLLWGYTMLGTLTLTNMSWFPVPQSLHCCVLPLRQFDPSLLDMSQSEGKGDLLEG